ncbi:double-strand break repair helicase AddA [Sphingomonas flavalba]|uniref:double-strand break repair helicase AddA n=1 Tax=Sphingomonas flavalba TaxID=2559804 RepID=UPI0039E06381
MADGFRPLDRLNPEQIAAAAPDAHVWLSASAGTGKTQVLMARVLRLLLRPGFDPSTLLCLTFTKAGAAEMADRIHARLAGWVRLDEPALKKELFALDEPHDDPAVLKRARTLFARVLDAAGGGLRIQTIHAFCQTLLAGFPVEAGLIPGFRPMEAREEAVLARSVLAALVTQAEAAGDGVLIGALQRLSIRLGEGGAEGYLMRCARAPEEMAALPAALAPALRRAFAVPEGDVEVAIIEGCADGAFDTGALRAVAAANAAWASKTGLDTADRIAAWLAADPPGRAAALDGIVAIAFTAAGSPRKISPRLIEHDPGYAEAAMRVSEAAGELLALRARAELADLFAAGLEAGRRFAAAYAEAKRAGGRVDFDDLIRRVVRLLGTPGMGDWIRYKLDQATDHILIDEAQDTNARQWAIVGALADEFFAGEGARGDRLRTLFSVGDYKQAIFGFQGTDPLFFAAARLRFARLAQAEVDEGIGQGLRDLSLTRSFRSTAPVLAAVDAVIAEVGADALGEDLVAEPHLSAVPGPGAVTLLAPVSAEAEDAGEAEGEEGWVNTATRRLAGGIAAQVRRWLDAPLWLESKGRPLAAEDVLILVRRRGDLASLIVARLHAEGVPVAGIDRLMLGQPLAVQDLLAAARFALQPQDDLTLAALLVSPLIGWTQDDLFAHGYREEGHGLWAHLRRRGGIDDTLAALRAILAAADLVTPYQFFEQLLSGALDGRRKLLRRLGAEARDPIDELLNAALRFEAEAAPSLQRFVDWFDRGDVEIVRDPSKPHGAVRVMTVHGAKGLQAPLVILADATVDPANSPARALAWPLEPAGAPVPIIRPRKAEAAGSLAELIAETERRELQEHWRLLYVAMTRAEERLVIGGALGPRARGVAAPDSWHAAAERALTALGVEAVADPDWGSALHFTGSEPARPVARARAAAAGAASPVAVPDWLHQPAPQEERPSRPLAPSALGDDQVADPPATPALRRAAERGRLLHALFERLPGVAAADRRAAADAWLAATGGIAEAAERRAIADAALAVIEAPGFADIFGPDALAEAPIAAVVGTQVVAGTVDRLLVTPERVLIVDFKTGRQVPRNIDEVPDYHLKQMGGYAAALRVIFPDRPVEAALLYTAGPRLLPLDAALLAHHKPGLAADQQSLDEGA